MGTKEELCIKCGMTISVEKPAELPKPPEPEKTVSPPPPPPEPPKPAPEPPKPVKKFKALDLVIIADDSPSISKMAKDTFIKNSLAKDVIVCSDGADFIASFMSIIKKDLSPSLAVLALSLPRLNGLETAVAMRSMEIGGKMQPIPIIFLTSRQPDEKFEQVISGLKPADHLYKGTEPNREQFEYMLTNIVTKLFPDNYEYIIMK